MITNTPSEQQLSLDNTKLLKALDEIKQVATSVAKQVRDEPNKAIHLIKKNEI